MTFIYTLLSEGLVLLMFLFVLVMMMVVVVVGLAENSINVKVKKSNVFNWLYTDFDGLQCIKKKKMCCLDFSLSKLPK